MWSGPPRCCGPIGGRGEGVGGSGSGPESPPPHGTAGVILYGRWIVNRSGCGGWGIVGSRGGRRRGSARTAPPPNKGQVQATQTEGRGSGGSGRGCHIKWGEGANGGRGGGRATRARDVYRSLPPEVRLGTQPNNRLALKGPPPSQACRRSLCARACLAAPSRSARACSS